MENRWKVRELVGEELFIPIDLRGGKGWGPVEEEGGLTLPFARRKARPW